MSRTSSSTSTSASSSSRSARRDEHERMCLVAAAVAMVERGAANGGKVSVRYAADCFGVSKSTVHRHIQANRGIEPPRRRRTKGKCDLDFILNRENAPPPRQSRRHQ